MKKILHVLGALALLGAGSVFVSCGGMVEGDKNYTFASTTIGTPDVTAKAWPGANILTWKAVNDAAGYTVYRTVAGGEREFVLSADQTELNFIDTDLDEGTTYTYRVVASPVDTTAHDPSQRVVTLTTAKAATGTNLAGTWAPEATVFSDLAQYEQGYNVNDTVLAADTISAKLILSDGVDVRVSFPTKPYAVYTVYLSQVNGGLVTDSRSYESKVEIYGFEYDGTATVTLEALYPGEKQVTVRATPVNDVLYGESLVASAATVTVLEENEIEDAVYNDVSAEWTNYNADTKVATARVFFTPYVHNGEEFAASEYSIYRALYDSNGESITIPVDDDDTDLNVYTSIVSLGSPKVDTEVAVNGATVYYLDDDSIDLSYAADISGVRYFVVLNHKGRILSSTQKLTVPTDADGNWNFTPEEAPGTVINSVSIADILIDNAGIAYVGATLKSTESKVSGTYGTFDTYNEAETAALCELPVALTVVEDDTTADLYDYLASTGTVTVNTDKYYVFRLLATRDEAKDSVSTVIAKPYKAGGAYYWDVLAKRPVKYVEPSGLSFSLSSSLTTTTYNSVALDYGATAGVWYNIYRYIGETSSVDDDTFAKDAALLTTTTETAYTDDAEAVAGLGTDKFIFYKVVAVGYYGKQESEITRAKRLVTPAVSLATTTLSWDAISAASSYRIYRATSETALVSQSETNYYTSVSQATAPSYLATSYTGDYYFAVRAYDWVTGEYSPLSVIKYVEKTAAPTVALSDDANPVLSWNAVTSATEYRIYRATSIDALSSANVFATVTTGTSRTLEPSYQNTYYYAVKAYSSIIAEPAATALSNTVSVAKIAAPTLALAEDGVTISWSAVTNASEYHIFRATSESDLASASYYTYITDTRYTATKDLASGYYYAVKAYHSGDDNGAEYTDLSAAVLVARQDPPVITLATDDSREITWDAIAGAASYEVYRATSEAGLASASVYATVTTGTSYTAPEQYRTWYYAVKAKNGTKATELSNTVAVDPIVDAPAATLADDGVTISWPAVTNASTYYIYRATSEEALAALADTASYTSTTSTSFTATKDWGVTYKYAVKAYSSSLDEYTDASNAITVESTVQPPATELATDGVTLNWTAVSGATTYYVYRARTAEALAALADTAYYTSTTNTTYMVTKSDYYAYYYAVKASNGSSYTDFSATHEVARDTTNGENIAFWEKTSDGSYKFTGSADTDSFVWSSNNQNMNSSTATTTWTITVSEEVSVSIPWTVSSESGWDKLTVTLDGTTKVNGSSGSNQSGTITATLDAGTHTVTATYSKDSSQSSGTDTATVTLTPVLY